MKTALLKLALFNLLVFSLFSTAGCGNGEESISNESFYFAPLSTSVGLPGDPATIQGWIDNENTSAMASHALLIWGALNQDSGQIFQGRMLPVWETWYSGDEIYDSQTLCSSTQRPTSTTNFESPRQFTHTNVADENISSMNKFDGFYANNVCDNLYNNPNVLTALNASFTASTPILARSIQGFDTGTTALKPVFMLVNQTGYTSIPYWEGAENSTNFQSPASNTWNQCVAVNPSLERSQFSNLPNYINQACNGVNVPQQVFSLNDFYHFPLTQADIDNFGSSAAGEMAGAQPGDYAVLVAMHVTMKEIPQWTWQTFWWHPNPDASPAPAIPRPTEALRAIPAPFNHYAMCTAYQMVIPEEVGTTPLICFNPYLEPGLVGVVGKESNCMTCHSYATWGDGGDFGGGLNYQANGYVDQSSDIFSDVTKLDFMWSVTRASDNSSN